MTTYVPVQEVDKIMDTLCLDRMGDVMLECTVKNKYQYDFVENTQEEFEKYCVDYARHYLTGYHEILEANNGWDNMPNLYYKVKRKVLELIKENYQNLADACDIQLSWINKNEVFFMEQTYAGGNTLDVIYKRSIENNARYEELKKEAEENARRKWETDLRAEEDAERAVQDLRRLQEENRVKQENARRAEEGRQREVENKLRKTADHALIHSWDMRIAEEDKVRQKETRRRKNERIRREQEDEERGFQERRRAKEQRVIKLEDERRENFRNRVLLEDSKRMAEDAKFVKRISRKG